MFDPAILLSLEASMPPQPPMMAEERLWLSPAGATAQRIAERLAAAYNAQADEWISEIDAIRSQFETTQFADGASADELSKLEEFVAEYETHADLRALTSARLTKRIRRDVKRHFQIDPSYGAVTRSLGDRLIATDKRIVEALLDYALFLRAIRAEVSGDAQGGPTFDNADDLQRHLDSLAA